jgi:hypothetical protein
LGGWRKRKKCRKGEKGRIQDERTGGNRKEGTNDPREGGRERERRLALQGARPLGDDFFFFFCGFPKGVDPS